MAKRFPSFLLADLTIVRAVGLCRSLNAIVISGVLASVLPNAPAADYTYDLLNRLKSADYGNGTLITYTYDAAGNRTSRVVQSPYSAQPQIVVQDNGTSPATTLADGTSVVQFGPVPAGQNTVRTFTLSTLGIPDLTGLAVTVVGANAADFAAIQPAVFSLSTNASTTFTVRFSPSTPGSKFASVRIASNDPNHNPFTFSISGACPPLIESWRQANFGTTANTGNAADSATPQNDGITNLMKFATGMDPTKSGTNPGASTVDGSNITFIYTRSKAAVIDGVIFAVEWSDDLSPESWSATGVSEATVDQGSTELVTATISRGSGSRRFVHLRVNR